MPLESIVTASVMVESNNKKSCAIIKQVHTVMATVFLQGSNSRSSNSFFDTSHGDSYCLARQIQEKNPECNNSWVTSQKRNGVGDSNSTERITKSVPSNSINFYR